MDGALLPIYLLAMDATRSQRVSGALSRGCRPFGRSESGCAINCGIAQDNHRERLLLAGDCEQLLRDISPELISTTIVMVLGNPPLPHRGPWSHRAASVPAGMDIRNRTHNSVSLPRRAIRR